MPIRRRAALLAPLIPFTRPALAQDAAVADYPSRPVRIIVPYPPGQSSDTLGRIVADILSRRWPQRVFVENRGGAGGVIGMEAVARAVPDGYTLAYVAIGPMNVVPAMLPNIPYDPVRDFTPIAVVSNPPVVLVAHPSLPVRDIHEFVAYARETPLDYASGGPGTVQHMAGELLRHQLGLKLNHVAYRGSGAAVTDTVAGVVKVMMDSLNSAVPHIRAGKLRALALTGGDGVPSLPGLPIIGRTVAPGYEVVGWSGFFAPAGTPEAIIRRANADLLDGLRDPALRERLENGGTVIAPPWTPEQARDFVHGQVAYWGRVIREAGLRIDG
jgi:tripartite-type tricarboxylate transporter receptor subunit TctC